MLVLDNIRQEFAKFLSEDPSGRWRMDAALVHVVQMAYQQGIEDGYSLVKEVEGAPPLDYLTDKKISTRPAAHRGDFISHGRTLPKSTTYTKPMKDKK